MTRCRNHDNAPPWRMPGRTTLVLCVLPNSLSPHFFSDETSITTFPTSTATQLSLRCRILESEAARCRNRLLNGLIRKGWRSCLPLSATPEGAAKWLATGLENQGNLTVKGSIPSPSAIWFHGRVVMQRVANPPKLKSCEGSTPSGTANSPERATGIACPSRKSRVGRDLGLSR